MEPSLSTIAIRIANWPRSLAAKLTRRRAGRDVAVRLYGDVVRQARRPEFFTNCGVPDTAEGRFEMIALHAFLVLHRLKRDGDPAPDPASDLAPDQAPDLAPSELAQAMFDAMFQDMDRNLREMGTGDLGVGRRVKALAQSFYGSISAYEAGLEGEDHVLSGALKRNVYGNIKYKGDGLQAMVAYLRREAKALDRMAMDRLLENGPGFGDPPRP